MWRGAGNADGTPGPSILETSEPPLQVEADARTLVADDQNGEESTPVRMANDRLTPAGGERRTCRRRDVAQAEDHPFRRGSGHLSAAR